MHNPSRFTINLPDDSIFLLPQDPKRYSFTINGIEWGTGKYFMDLAEISKSDLYCYLRCKKVLDVDVYIQTNGTWNIPSISLLNSHPQHFRVVKEIINGKSMLSPAFSTKFMSSYVAHQFAGPYDEFTKEYIDFDKTYHPRDYFDIRKNWYCYASKGDALYHRYIASSRWKKRSDACKEAAGHFCQVCGQGGVAEGLYVPLVGLHTHHLTYEHIYDEYDIDLLVVCAECHRYLHERYDGTDKDPRKLRGSFKKLYEHRQNILAGRR
jgi:hypothetical protein